MSSTSKAANVYQQLSHEGIDAETFFQSGIYRFTITEAVKLKEEIKKNYTWKTVHWIFMVNELMTKNMKCLS